MVACKDKDSAMGKYPIAQVPFTSVKVTDNFWAPKIRINHEVTIPIAFGYCESTGRVKNFEIAGGLAEGDRFIGSYPFDDSDVYKIIEGAGFSLQTFPDPELEAYVDSLIYKIGMAQEDDGYLYTNRTINGEENVHPWSKGGRWVGTHDLSHELYNMGHLYEAAVAYYQATGKRALLDIAIKSADLIDNDFGWDKIDEYVNYPGHQVIEMGLVKLYNTTGEKRYLELAKFFLDVRGNGPEYSQAHLPVVEQTEAVGHSVRATYMYSGMADVAALYEDKAYINAISKIWEDIVYTKMYLTGGIGASGGNEGFGEHYHLPNMSAYCETCASIGNIFTNHRLFLLHGDSKYYDVLEKTLYNGMLSGVSLSGDHFFYPNPLESYGQHERSEWFGCACCPSNISRFIPAVPGYIYATDEKKLYVNLYMDNSAEINLNGEIIDLIQHTEYPWKGDIEITVNPDKQSRFAMMMRIPGWALNEALPGKLYSYEKATESAVELFVNGTKVNYKISNGYAVINRNWKEGDKVRLHLPMEIHKVVADKRVEADLDRLAIQRGPMIYCAEWPDNIDGMVRNLMLDTNEELSSEFIPDMLNGAVIIKAKGRQTKKTETGEVVFSDIQDITLIPYHLWANRGAGEMMVWLPVAESAVNPLPAPTIANSSLITSSKPSGALRSITDQYNPKNSNDHTNPYFHFWPNRDKSEWIQCDFGKTETVSSTSIYWFDDSPDGGCSLPAGWEVLYRSGEKWVPVKNLSAYTITKDNWDKLEFEPVNTSALRIRIDLSREFSTGVHELVIN